MKTRGEKEKRREHGREIRQRQDFSLNSQISFTRGGENMEQPSLLLQLSSLLHQLNMAVDHTGGEEEKEKGTQRPEREDRRKGDGRGGEKI